MDYLAYFITAASILGTVANSLQKRWCFWVWLCTNSFWCIYNTINGQYAQTLLYVFNLITCIVGLLKWQQINDALKAAKETMPETDRGEGQPTQTTSNREDYAKALILGFHTWRMLLADKRVFGLAYSHKNPRVRKKNRARLRREYKKYIRRNSRV